jgi:hypothetical protein
MDLVNQAIQYDRRCGEKPFFPNRHSLLVWPPAFNWVSMHVALQQSVFLALHGLI